MSNNTELFELCKEVYEKTGWDNTLGGGLRWLLLRNGDYDTFRFSDAEAYQGSNAIKDKWSDGIPLYTSDYLLEKLHGQIDINLYSWAGGNWRADAGEGDFSRGGDTPLLALLKLTLALHEAKELV